jgi:hypothetical protein
MVLIVRQNILEKNMDQLQKIIFFRNKLSKINELMELVHTH